MSALVCRQVNAFILHETYYGRELREQLDFRLELIDAMLRMAGVDTRVLLAQRARRLMPGGAPRPVTDDVIAHCPMVIPPHKKKETGEPVTSARECVRCRHEDGVRHETGMMCGSCNVALCVRAERNCFREYHLARKEGGDGDAE